MTDWAAIVGTGGAVLGPVGAAGAFVWRKIERRFTKVEGELEECRKSHKEADGSRAVQLTVIELMWQELERVAPASAVLKRAKRLLDGANKQTGAAGLWAAAAELGLLVDKETGK